MRKTLSKAGVAVLRPHQIASSTSRGARSHAAALTDSDAANSMIVNQPRPPPVVISVAALNLSGLVAVLRLREITDEAGSVSRPRSGDGGLF